MKQLNKKRPTNIAAIAFVVGILMAGTTSTAHATLMLRIDDGTTSITVTDNDSNDTDLLGINGMIEYRHIVDSPSSNIFDFDIITSSGVSKPVIGGGDDPNLHFNSVRVTSSDFTGLPTILTISLTDTDFTGPIDLTTAFLSSFGGVTDGSVSLKTYFDASNTEFGESELIAELGDYSGGAFSGDSVDYINTSMAGLYSLTMVATITHTGSDQDTSFDATIDVPEPGVLALLGIGLLAGGSTRRRRAD